MEIIVKNSAHGEHIFTIGFLIIDSSIDIVLTFEFGHDNMILKMAIFDEVDYTVIEPTLMRYRIQCLLPERSSFPGV